eukprot:gb/GECG01010205.1/.p1 GENE.gb/GECG01010205.1/~~gb/GECG01010205.1/.p1  ORF type:complete len:218 (+),score=16.54 gb/GECG01010205.1/:1-654(+)
MKSSVAQCVFLSLSASFLAGGAEALRGSPNKRFYEVDAPLSESRDMQVTKKMYMSSLGYMPPPEGGEDPVEGRVCDFITRHLPSECSVSHDCRQIHCDKSIEGQDFEVGININVCSDPINVDMFVKDKNMGVGYHKKLSASGRWDIPGISWSIPHVGEVGATVPYSVEGEQHALTLHLGLQGCLDIGSKQNFQECFPKSGHEIISGTFDFSYVTCKN